VSQESAAADTKPQQDVAELEERIAELSERLENFAAEKAEMIKTSNRRAKDFQNYKTRTEREKNELFANQLCNIATEMLPALDNLDRAVVFARGLPDDQPTDFRQFVDGVILVNQQVNDVLADLGIEAIPTIGHLFDPHYHEAVATEESEEFPPNTICGELLRGYRIGERVVRHSLVKVAAGGAEPDDQPGEDEENAPAERDEADPAYDPDANDIDRNDDPDNEADEHDELS
jgi:molecular chaperone GrpE